MKACKNSLQGKKHLVGGTTKLKNNNSWLSCEIKIVICQIISVFMLNDKSIFWKIEWIENQSAGKYNLEPWMIKIDIWREKNGWNGMELELDEIQFGTLNDQN